ncbi:MAG TPA: hypothetical protein VFI29_16395 [Hanamia sp.]|nr:hypothetical protein [Hanamia sp.]
MLQPLAQNGLPGMNMDRNRLWVSVCTASPRNGFPPMGKGMQVGLF